MVDGGSNLPDRKKKLNGEPYSFNCMDFNLFVFKLKNKKYILNDFGKFVRKFNFMGRWFFSSRQEADHLNKIKIWWLKKQGFLCGWKSGGIEWSNGFSGKSSIDIEVSLVGDLSQKEEREKYLNTDDDSSLNKYVRLRYAQTNRNGEKKSFNYKVQLTTTPCYYGGVRYWFICPLGCGRRVGVLYGGGDYFGCRHCYNLTYSSRNENLRIKYDPTFRFLSLVKRLEELEQTIKRRVYAGNPTKKQREYLRLLQEQAMIGRFGKFDLT